MITALRVFFCVGRTIKSWAQQWLHGLFSQMNNFRRFGKPSMWLVFNPFLIEFVNSCLSAARCRTWSFTAVSDFHSPGASAAAPGWTQDTSQQDSLHFKSVCLASAHFPDLVFYNIYFSFLFSFFFFAFFHLHETNLATARCEPSISWGARSTNAQSAALRLPPGF